MKKYFVTISIILCSVFNLQVAAVFAEENEKELAKEAESAILIEQHTGQVLFDKQADKSLPPASMTKIMTMLLIMEEMDRGKLKETDMVKVSEHAASMGGSQLFLEAGEEMTVKDLLKGIAIASGNDASVALAEHISGSEAAFVKAMNQKAKSLGLDHTTFKNTTGLPAKGHKSTARDMAMIAKELVTYEQILEYTSLYEDYLRKGTEDEFWLVNTNKLVKFHDDVDGLKTGYTKEAKYCLTATAEKDDMRVISVVMGAEKPKERNQATTDMLDYAYNNYETTQKFAKNEHITNFEHFKAKPYQTPIITKQAANLVHEKGKSLSHLTKDVHINKNITLPIQKCDVIGSLKLKQDDKVVSETDLTVEQDITKADYFTLLKRSMQQIVNVSE